MFYPESWTDQSARPDSHMSQWKNPSVEPGRPRPETSQFESSGKLPHPSEPQFLHLEAGNSPAYMGLLWGLMEERCSGSKPTGKKELLRHL